MTPAVLTNWDKAAILLRALAPESNKEVLNQLEPTQAKQLRGVMEAIARRSDLDQITQQVLREFQELRRDPTTTGADPMGGPHHSANWIARQYGETADSSAAGLESDASNNENVENVDLSDTAGALSKTSAAVLARVLKSEPPRVMAIVLQNLPAAPAASILKLISPEARESVIGLMAMGLNFSQTVTDRVLKTVLELCSTMTDVEDPTPTEDGQVKQLAGILQAVDREERLRLMGLLGEQNGEIAAKIDDCLYDYTDLLRLADRSLQKILTQTDQKTLALALKSAPNTIKDKVMKNMSERVRAALSEEMEFLSVVPAVKAEAARKEITAIIRAQDKEGSLVWLET